MKNSVIKISDNEFLEDLDFSSGHALIMGHKPVSLNAERITSKLEEFGGMDVTSFGLFDNSTPNYTTYYPEVKAEDLNPQESDFIYPVFRMLSAGIVNAATSPIDFSKPGVLKASMPMCLGLTVNIDHEMAVGNAIGAVSEVFWQNSYTDKATGQVIPAGINGVFKIDGKSNPRIARGIMMSPPSINSNSVTIRFAWSKSHPNLTDDEFYSRWGTLDENGELVRKMATNIVLYRETSIVSWGADPYAQGIRDNRITDPGRAKMINSLSYIDYKMPKTYTFDAKTHISENRFSFNNPEPQMDILQLITTLGLSNITTEVELKAYIDNLSAENVRLKGLETQVAELNTTITQLRGELPSPEVIAALALPGIKGLVEGPNPEQTLADLNAAAEGGIKKLKETVIANFRILKGDNASADIIASFDNATFAQLEAFNAEYKGLIEESMPLQCSDCKSTNVTRASTTKHSTTKSDPTESLEEKDLKRRLKTFTKTAETK